MTTKTLFAIDFDGVICDSAVETALTGWAVAQGIWPDMQGQAITSKELQQFRKIRPLLEFGYEAILIMRLLQQSVAVNELCENYHQQLQSLIESNDLSVDALKDQFGQTRDRQITQDEAAWIASNPVFEGIVFPRSIRVRSLLLVEVPFSFVICNWLEIIHEIILQAV